MYKVQLKSAGGWSDVKSSEDGSNYTVETFSLKVDAENEMHDMIQSFNDSQDDYRVVSSDVKEEFNLY